ncbi:hypothetical protein Lepto7375DRAFT_3328 [Leptolyngbya sp. PCC 7375]|nr:hypothetical protein Lepto7375DRAFT_3328 [Leptolyngbya sp. PCC 7375]
MVSQRHWPVKATVIFLASLVVLPTALYCFIVWKLYAFAAMGI